MAEEIFRSDGYARSCTATVTAVEAEGVRLDRTVFYPNGGGQPGDVGVLRLADGAEIVVSDSRKTPDGDVLHVLAGPSALAAGDVVTAEIDWPRRHRLMRMHTCLHLVSALVEGKISGAGVGDGKGRVDFDCGDKVPDREALEAALNRIVGENRPVRIRWITDAELEAQPELVRTLTVLPPMGTGRVRLVEVEGVDLQPCGGTHVAATGEIGPVRIVKIENKGKHNRRVNVAFPD